MYNIMTRTLSIALILVQHYQVQQLSKHLKKREEKGSIFHCICRGQLLHFRCRLDRWNAVTTLEERPPCCTPQTAICSSFHICDETIKKWWTGAWIHTCFIYCTVALCHLKWALESANPLILEQPLKRTIEDNLFLLFFLSGWTKNKWIRTFQWQKATVWSMEGSGECES